MKNPFIKAKEKAKQAQIKLYDKTLGLKIEALPFEKQVQLARSLSIGPPALVAKNLLAQLPEDFRKMADKGITQEQIKDRYWGCKEFREWWELLFKGLEDKEAFFDGVLKDSLIAYIKGG